MAQRRDRTDRVLTILKTLREDGPQPLRRLAIRFHVDTRTIRRDVAALQRYGFAYRSYSEDDRRLWACPVSTSRV